MKFRDWINEGWGINQAQLPPDMDSKLGWMGSKNVRKSVIDNLYQSNFVSFDPTDRPQDFIRIEPLNQMENLPVASVANPLPSFEGSTIYYGFRFSKPKLDVEAPIKAEIKKLEEEQADLQAKLKTANAKEMTSQVKQIIDQEHEKLIQRGFDIKRIEEYLPHLVNRRVEEIGRPRVGWGRISRYLRSRSGRVETDSAYKTRKRLKQIPNELANLQNKIADKARLYRALELAFVKKLKEPHTTADQMLQKQFIELAINTFMRFMGNRHYDYVMYPQSSSSLNPELALGLAARLNAQPIQGFVKKLGDQVPVDNHNLYAAIPDKEKARQIASALKGNLSSFVGKKDNLSIKNVSHNLHPYRKYYRHWNMAPGLKQQGYGLKNRSILVVDDNVSSGGTFEATVHVLQQHGPRRVDCYAPLKIS